ncbi:chemotaxis protein methyltransferase CheR [Maridesulfovibrio ferrireducens]|uniref:Chemotaxis protein methyltransferase CheR n=1 Tax=Maridesulfovibrio ferrireducens TaxID=246191 RepID=A0A1G9GVU5_9BACT|nr:protein-glutamate O-methyltransferase CheR [Maridesulfovibrio ferrireducens]SDL04791.1 chemotaxis protein methyltransferase CheR [Maridesulfovibrio ferrireducens]
MIDFISDEKIDLLSQMVRDIYGLKFSPDRWNDLKAAVVKAGRELGKFKSADECLDYLLSPQVGEKDLELFINQLTIGETYFFRDPGTLGVLERDILLKISGTGSGRYGAVRVWSMACATGEEPYTVAMMCRRSNVRSEIFGTDIDSEALLKAAEGSYRKWSFRIESNNFKDVYFKSDTPNFFQLDQSIKDMVRFSRLNLIGDALPTYLWGMDVVLCRNVLIYFSEDGVRLVLDKIWESLNSDGWLVVTPSESALVTAHGKFEPVSIGSVLVFRKNKEYLSKNFNEVLNNFYEKEFNELSDGDDLDDALNFDSDNYIFCDPEPDPLAHDRIEPYAASDPVSGPAENFVSLENLNPIEEACVLREKGDYAAALSLLKRSLDNNLPRSTAAEVLLAIAEIKADSGLLDEAAHWCNKSIEADRVASYPHFLLGQIRMAEGDFDAALCEIRKAVFLDGSFIMAHFVLGNIYLSQKDNSAAARHFRISLQELEKIDKDMPVPHSDRATAGRLIEMIKLVKNNIV